MNNAILQSKPLPMKFFRVFSCFSLFKNHFLPFRISQFAILFLEDELAACVSLFEELFEHIHFGFEAGDLDLLMLLRCKKGLLQKFFQFLFFLMKLAAPGGFFGSTFIAKELIEMCDFVADATYFDFADKA